MSDPSLPACHVHAPRTSTGGCTSCGTWLCAVCLGGGVCPVCGLALESADSEEEEDPAERPAGVSEITVLFGTATDRALRGGRRIGLFLLDPWRRLPSLALLAPLVGAPYWAFETATDLLHAGSLVGAGVAVALAAALWLVLVPVSLFATLEFLLGTVSLRVSLARSWRMGRGRRWALVLATVLALLLEWMGAILPLVGLLAIVFVPVFWILFQVALYHLTRARTDLPPLDDPGGEAPAEEPSPALA